MALISGANLSKSYGEHTLFSGASFEIGSRDIIGFIGANGTGKTTLFKIITGQLQPDSGGVARESGLTVGYMEQYTCQSSERTALDEILTVFESLMETEARLEALSNRLLTDHSDSLIAEHAALTEEFQRAGGLTYMSRAVSTLRGLGFSDEEIRLPVSALSGGQKSKIALGRLLLARPKLLLLDEPTNHLDIKAVEWLEEYVKGYTGAAVIISHDRFFLDRVCTRIFELESKALYTFKGNYTAYREHKELRRKTEEREYKNTMKEISRIEGIIEQQRRWNREKNIKTAESKEKQVARLEATLKKPDALPEDIHFKFDVKRRTGNDVLSVKDLTKSFGDTKLYTLPELDVKYKDRVFFIGPNGCGKTTLLKQLLSKPEEAYFGVGADIGYYEQTHESLSMDKTVLDEIWDAYRDMTQTEIRSALAVFLFKGDDVFKKIEALSGGERAKVALCKLMLSGCNILFLDEPTNHLDITSREALEKALETYDGTLIMVSHDRYFINRLAQKICAFENGEVRVYNGDYDNYLRLRPADTETQAAVVKQLGKGGTEYKQKKQNAAELRKLKARLRKCEADISSAEEETSKKRAELESPEAAADYKRAMELSDEIAALDEHIAALMEEWETLSAQLEEKEN